MAKNAPVSLRKALGDELYLPTAVEEAIGIELPKPASSEGFKIPQITMLSASIALSKCGQLWILQGSRQEFIQPSWQPRGRAGDQQPHSMLAQADTRGLIHPSSYQAKGGWGHLRGCPHPLSPHGTTRSGRQAQQGRSHANGRRTLSWLARHDSARRSSNTFLPAQGRPHHANTAAGVRQDTSPQKTVGWEVGGDTNTGETHTPPSSFHINKS